jgi:hypothetical protein
MASLYAIRMVRCANGANVQWRLYTAGEGRFDLEVRTLDGGRLTLESQQGITIDDANASLAPGAEFLMPWFEIEATPTDTVLARLRAEIEKSKGAP